MADFDYTLDIQQVMQKAGEAMNRATLGAAIVLYDHLKVSTNFMGPPRSDPYEYPHMDSEALNDLLVLTEGKALDDEAEGDLQPLSGVGGAEDLKAALSKGDKITDYEGNTDWAVVSQVPYTLFLEYGTSKMEPRLLFWFSANEKKYEMEARGMGILKAALA